MAGGASAKFASKIKFLFIDKNKRQWGDGTLVVIQLGGITNIYDMAAGSGPSAVGSFSLIAAKRWRRLATHEKINTRISTDVFNSLNNQLKSV